MSNGILAGGNWIIDKLKFVDTYPAEEALTNIRRQSIGNGGSPFNILLDLGKLGAPFPLAAAGLVGNDADGKWITAECARHNIDTAQLRPHPTAPTSYTDVFIVEKTGKRTFFHQRGANAHLDNDHFQFTNDTFRIFHLGYLLLLDRLDEPDPEYGTVAARLLARARQAGAKTSIDVVSEDSDRFAQIVLPTLPHVDYCILNEFELGRTTNLPVRGKNGIDLPILEKAARQLLAAGVREWVIVHFPEGACALGQDGKLRHQGSLKVPQTDIVSNLGAGDAFAAGVLYGLHEQKPIEECLKYGICAAAACLQGAGTSDGLRPLNDCLALEKKYGVR